MWRSVLKQIFIGVSFKKEFPFIISIGAVISISNNANGGKKPKLAKFMSKKDKDGF